MKKILTNLLLAIMVISLMSCSGTASVGSTSQTVTTTSDIIPEGGSLEPVSQVQTVDSALITSNYDSDDLSASVEDAYTTFIRLKGDSVAVDGSGATVNGQGITITAAGTYEVQGILNDGQIVIDTQDAETVTLILNGADITNSTSAPIYVANTEKVVITLADGTENTVTDGATHFYPDESNEPNAAIFSNDDLTINGTGALTVNANYNNGIASDDDLKIVSGTITVNAVHDGIKGKDSVLIKDGVITINAGADGIQSSNTENAEKGYILIEGGTFNITSALDGVQAETNLQINAGDFTITSGGGSVNTSTNSGGMWGGPGMEGNPNKPEESAKGLKAGVDLSIMAGTFNINSADDSIHANNAVTINDGAIQIASGDDGIHADATLIINGGEINLTQSYEGLESAVITVNGGTIHLNASDDGINAGGGADGSSIGGRPGQNDFAAGNYYVYINGGYLFVDAGGDGLDTNGSFEMTDGVVLVNGPTNNSNGPLDYNGTFNVSGGFLVAVGSSGMAQAPSDTSTQYAVMYNFDTVQSAGTMLHIETQNGQEILTFMPTKEYQSVMISSSELKNGETYLVYTGGSASGAAIDGLYEGSLYTPGTQVASFTTSSMVTSIGAIGGGPGGGRPGGGPGGQPPTRP